MNSHQSLAEALETCKYTENFTSHGARSCSRCNPPRTHPRATKRDPLPRTVESLDTSYSENRSSAAPTHLPPRIKQHNTATSEVTYSWVYQQFTTCNKEKESSTVHKSCRSIWPRECSKWEVLCKRWGEENKETSARFTHKRQSYTQYNVEKSGKTHFVKGWKRPPYTGFLINLLTHFEDEEEGEQNFLWFSLSLTSHDF